MGFRRANNRVAVVGIEGVISDGGSIGSDRGKIIDSLKEAERRRARAIVLRVNSPGGTVGACQEIHSAIARLVERRIPVVASMGDIAASGGVYVSMSATEVIANPGTITGSIGVIIKGNDLSALYQRVGISPKVVKSGPHKDMLSSYRAFSDEEQVLMQSLIDDSHAQFVEAVAAARKKSRDEVERIADGRILTGRQAMESGLVDRLGGLDLAVDRAAELAGIIGKPKVIRVEPKRKFLARLLSPFFGSLAFALFSLRQMLVLNEYWPSVRAGDPSGWMDLPPLRPWSESMPAIPMWIAQWP